MSTAVPSNASFHNPEVIRKHDVVIFFLSISISFFLKEKYLVALTRWLCSAFLTRRYTFQWILVSHHLILQNTMCIVGAEEVEGWAQDTVSFAKKPLPWFFLRFKRDKRRGESQELVPKAIASHSSRCPDRGDAEAGLKPRNGKPTQASQRGEELQNCHSVPEFTEVWLPGHKESHFSSSVLLWFFPYAPSKQVLNLCTVQFKQKCLLLLFGSILSNLCPNKDLNLSLAILPTV